MKYKKGGENSTSTINIRNNPISNPSISYKELSHTKPEQLSYITKIINNDEILKLFLNNHVDKTTIKKIFNNINSFNTSFIKNNQLKLHMQI